MLVLDASALYEVLADAPRGDEVRRLLAADGEMAAPHLIDAEVLAVIQGHHRRGLLDDTAAEQAACDLLDWPGRRWSHRRLLMRACELRHNVRTYDGLYVALAEALDAPLVTLDERLVTATGPRCRFIVPGRF